MSRRNGHTNRPTRRQRQRAGRPLGPVVDDWFEAMQQRKAERAEKRLSRQIDILFDVPSQQQRKTTP